ERLFVHSGKGRVVFASEAKAIVAVVPKAGAIDTVGLAEWLACGCTLGERSLFETVEVVPGAPCVTFGPGPQPGRTRYFDRTSLEGLTPLPAAQFLERFAESFELSVQRSIARAPQAALSLTGGIDSRLVLACAASKPQTVQCYTFGSMYRDTMDVTVARRAAAVSHQPHQVLELGSDFLSSIDEHLRRAVYLSDGYLGLTGSAELYLNRLARAVA